MNLFHTFGQCDNLYSSSAGYMFNKEELYEKVEYI